jgi:hypothetical protein
MLKFNAHPKGRTYVLILLEQSDEENIRNKRLELVAYCENDELTELHNLHL